MTKELLNFNLTLSAFEFMIPVFNSVSSEMVKPIDQNSCSNNCMKAMIVTTAKAKQDLTKFKIRLFV